MILPLALLSPCVILNFISTNHNRLNNTLSQRTHTHTHTSSNFKTLLFDAWTPDHTVFTGATLLLHTDGKMFFLFCLCVIRVLLIVPVSDVSSHQLLQFNIHLQRHLVRTWICDFYQSAWTLQTWGKNILQRKKFARGEKKFNFFTRKNNVL